MSSSLQTRARFTEKLRVYFYFSLIFFSLLRYSHLFYVYGQYHRPRMDLYFHFAFLRCFCLLLPPSSSSTSSSSLPLLLFFYFYFLFLVAFVCCYLKFMCASYFEISFAKLIAKCAHIVEGNAINPLNIKKKELMSFSMRWKNVSTARKKMLLRNDLAVLLQRFLIIEFLVVRRLQLRSSELLVQTTATIFV